MPTQTPAFGTQAADRPLEVMEIPRRDLQPDDVQLEVLFCGLPTRR